jgi:hypothetical protein
LQEAAKVTFADRQRRSSTVQRIVVILVGMFEVFVIVLGIPEVESEVNPGAGRILQELSLPEAWIAAKELDPRPEGVVSFFKGCFFSRLDFELP